MNTEMRALTIDEIDSVAGGVLDLGIVAAFGNLQQFANNQAVNGGAAVANTALQALNANQNVIAAGVVS